MSDYVRVTDDVKPRREFSVLASQVTPAHKVLDGKPGAHPDGTPIAPKYRPAQMSQTPASPESVKHNGGQTSPKEKE